MTRSRARAKDTPSGRLRAGSDVKHDRAGLKDRSIYAKKSGGGGHFTWGRATDDIKAADIAAITGAGVRNERMKSMNKDPLYDPEEDFDEDGIVFSVSNGDIDSFQGGIEQDGAVPNILLQYNQMQGYLAQDEAVPSVSRSKSLGNGMVNGSGNGYPYHGQDFSYLNYHGESLHPPKLSLPEFKEKISKLIREFFVEEDEKEFLVEIQKLDSTMLHYELVKKLITMSMEQTDAERELVSKVIIALQEWRMLSANQLAKGFERLFEAMDDLALDIPNAQKMLAQFVARCVADEALPPIFLNNAYIQQLAPRVVEHAKVLLSIKHGLVRLERIWGLNMTSTVDDLKKEIRLILEEFFLSRDAMEAVELIKKMNVPYFHHEIVKRGIVLAIEHSPVDQAMMSYFLKVLAQNQVISKQQLVLGFQRIYQEIEDIKLDNPNADQTLRSFTDRAIQDGILTSAELEDLKARSKEIAVKERSMLDEELARTLGRARSSSVPAL